MVRLSREWRLWDMFRSSGGRGATIRAFAKAFADERDRWALWLPVCLGSGIAFYFMLDREPSSWMGPLGIVAALAIGAMGRRRTGWLILAVAAGTAALGLTLAQFRTGWVAAPVLEKLIGPVRLEGRVVAEQRRAKGRRILLDRPVIQRLAPERTPERVRVTVRAMPDGARPGDRVSVRAILSPPPSPAAPGAFDFQRRAYFERLGAVGFSVSPVRLVRHGPPDSIGLAVQRLRQHVTARILAALDAPAGAVAAALMTGKSSEAENYPLFNLLAFGFPLPLSVFSSFAF